MIRKDKNPYSVISNILRCLVPVAIFLVVSGAVSALFMFLTVRFGLLGGAETVVDWTMDHGIAVVGLTDAVACLIFAMQLTKDRQQRLAVIEERGKYLRPVSILLLLICGAAVTVLLNLVLNLLPLSGMVSSPDTLNSMLERADIWVELAVTCFLAPLAEELCFRGLMYQRLREWLKAGPAMVISALAFALYHGNVLQGIYAFIVGLILAYVLYHYETVAAPVLLHIAGNLIVEILSFSGMMERMMQTSSQGWIIAGIMLVISLIALLGIIKDPGHSQD